MKPEIDAAFRRVYEGQDFILGKAVGELEDKISQFLGVGYAVGVGSGTDALELTLRAIAYTQEGKEKFSPGDKIITTPFTFVATADTALLAGATPVFSDIDARMYNLDPRKVRAYLENLGKDVTRVKAIIVVHLYGQPADISEFLAISKEYDIPIIEDVAQAFGAKWDNRFLGTFGIAGCLSFFPSKTLGAFGDGGMVVTSDPKLAEVMRMLRTHGGKDKYNVSLLGYNSRLDTLQAAILLAKLPHVDRWREGRVRVAGLYQKELSSVDGLILPVTDERGTHVWHQYTIATNYRDELQSFLKERGIGTSVYYPIPLHEQVLFQGKSERTGSLEMSEAASRSVLSLPIDPLQTDEETHEVIDAIKEFFAAKTK